MSREHTLDYEIKEQLIFDTINLVNPIKFDRMLLFDLCKKQRRKRRMLSGNQLEPDLYKILLGIQPRKYGMLPNKMGKFIRLAPGTDIFKELVN